MNKTKEGSSNRAPSTHELQLVQQKQKTKLGNPKEKGTHRFYEIQGGFRRGSKLFASGTRASPTTPSAEKFSTPPSVAAGGDTHAGRDHPHHDPRIFK